MKVYLIQRGEAISKEVNPGPPLSADGRRKLRRRAGFLASGCIRIARIMTSGITGVRQTAAILGAARSRAFLRKN
jgi:phosphohistidine phosphatase SixA